jgi:hypothetical protein
MPPRSRHLHQPQHSKSCSRTERWTRILNSPSAVCSNNQAVYLILKPNYAGHTVCTDLAPTSPPCPAGACVGAGVDLITAVDLRYCSTDAAFCVKVGQACRLQLWAPAVGLVAGGVCHPGPRRAICLWCGGVRGCCACMCDQDT